MKVNFSYLDRQFANIEDYLQDLREFVPTGDFTLGKPLQEFEASFAKYCGLKHAIGVASGTDALMLSIKIDGVGPGDEVITAANTFIATVGSIAISGATPVFVDSEDGFVIDVDKIEAAITPKTKAIMPVHYTGNVADMPRIMEIARKHNLLVYEDACQSIGGQIDGTPVGSWGRTASFSLHPLKNLNVWSDGGVILTNDKELDEKLRLYRNHGMLNRDEYAFYGHNSRLDTLQAVIGNRLIKEVAFITETRIKNANKYDEAFKDIEQIRVPVRRPGVKHVYHLYILRVENRDGLKEYLNGQGIEAKIHYPIPMHLQQAAKHLGYKKGDFPVAEADAECVITLPAHQHLTDDEMDYAIEHVRKFYKK